MTSTGEDPLPVTVRRDSTLRVKILDACGLSCQFCHNEGTPVLVDNLGNGAGTFVGSGRSGRVSIYAASNGVRFLPATVAADESFFEALTILRDALGFDEVHLTGGEPTLHPDLAGVIALAKNAGFRVAMTSNGENGARVMKSCSESGLDRINFSIFGTTPGELAQVQGSRYANAVRAERKIEALGAAIRSARMLGVSASANIVVPDISHAPRVFRLLDEYDNELSVRLLNSLDDGLRSVEAVAAILEHLGAVPFAHHVVAGASGWRTSYRLPNGRVIFFKQIRPVRLPRTCSGCRFNDGSSCQEGYYGVRLYRDRSGVYQVGVCIQRMDLCMPVRQFATSDICAEIALLRETEYVRLRDA